MKSRIAVIVVGLFVLLTASGALAQSANDDGTTRDLPVRSGAQLGIDFGTGWPYCSDCSPSGPGVAGRATILDRGRVASFGVIAEYSHYREHAGNWFAFSFGGLTTRVHLLQSMRTEPWIGLAFGTTFVGASGSRVEPCGGSAAVTGQLAAGADWYATPRLRFGGSVSTGARLISKACPMMFGSSGDEAPSGSTRGMPGFNDAILFTLNTSVVLGG